jgi:hypothetical protein
MQPLIRSLRRAGLPGHTCAAPEHLGKATPGGGAQIAQNCPRPLGRQCSCRPYRVSV